LGLIAAAKTGGFGVNEFLLTEKVYTRCFSLKLAWNDRFELKKNSSFELIVGLELIFWLSGAKNICLQGVWSVFFLFFHVKIWLKMSFSWSETDQPDFQWLDVAGIWVMQARSCLLLFNALKDLFFFKKKDPSTWATPSPS
jgi:hypothetical protein